MKLFAPQKIMEPETPHNKVLIQKAHKGTFIQFTVEKGTDNLNAICCTST
jgi:hypothetical protein